MKKLRFLLSLTTTTTIPDRATSVPGTRPELGVDLESSMPTTRASCRVSNCCRASSRTVPLPDAILFEPAVERPSSCGARRRAAALDGAVEPRRQLY